MKITDVKTVLLTRPSGNDPFLQALTKLRSAAFYEIQRHVLHSLCWATTRAAAADRSRFERQPVRHKTGGSIVAVRGPRFAAGPGRRDNKATRLTRRRPKPRHPQSAAGQNSTRAPE